MRKSAHELAADIQAAMGDAWLPRIYRERILRMRTRAYAFPTLPRNAAPDIHHTLLGIELKIGRRRMLCPDLATARYLAVLARIRCQAVAVPYDITKISQIADELESSWHRMLLLTDEQSREHSQALRTRTQRLLSEKVRDEIAAAGPGPQAPEFPKATKQRR